MRSTQGTAGGLCSIRIYPMKYCKRPAPLFAAVAVTLLSSCNRGFGCPGTNFSIEEFVTAVTTLLG